MNDLVTRFDTDTTPITQTWSISATEVAIISDTAGHMDGMTSYAAWWINKFLNDNAYPQNPNEMSSLVMAINSETGYLSLDDLGSISNGHIRVNLANISVSQIRFINMVHVQHDGTSWQPVTLRMHWICCMPVTVLL